MGVQDAASALIPPGIGKALKWRLTVSLSIGGLLVFVLWALGALTSIGLSSGFARADEAKAISARLGALETNQRTGLRLTLASEICRVYFLRMQAKDELWQQLNKSFNDRQEEYAAINSGQRYTVTECSSPK